MPPLVQHVFLRILRGARLRLTALVALAALAFPPGVLADQTGDAAKQEDEYRVLIDQAVTEYRMGNWPEARSLFARAHAINPSARTLRGIGLSAFEERAYVVAIQFLKRSVADQRKPLTDNQRNHANQIIDRSLGYIAQYDLELKPSGAEVLVDARPPVIVDGTLLLDPGTHQLVVSIEGHEQETRRIRAQPSERLVLRIELSPKPGSAVAQKETKSGSDAKGKTETKANIPLRKRLGWRRISGIAVASVGAAALATSLGLTLKARKLRDASGCNGNRCPNDGFDDYNQGVKLAKFSTAMVIVGGAALAAGATLTFWPWRSNKADTPPKVSPPKASATLAPALAPGFAGLSLAGRW